MDNTTRRATAASEMEQLSQQRQASLPRELLLFILGSKKYWLLPILLIMGLLGTLAFLGSSGVAPFIYPLF